MVLKPLGIGAQFFRTPGGIDVFEIHDGLPTGLHAERIAIGFNEAIGKVNRTGSILQPKNIVGIKEFEVACAIVLNEFVNNVLLLRCIGKGTCLLQTSYNALNGLAVKTADFPNALGKAPVGFYQTAVESVHHGMRI